MSRLRPAPMMAGLRLRNWFYYSKLFFSRLIDLPDKSPSIPPSGQCRPGYPLPRFVRADPQLDPECWFRPATMNCLTTYASNQGMLSRGAIHFIQCFVQGLQGRHLISNIVP